VGPKIQIKNANQIGGCITIISTNTTKIVIDFGEVLPGAEVTEETSFDWENEKVDAVFFTHYHGDHIGRFAEIPNEVPLYMGEVTYKILLNIYSRCKKVLLICLKIAEIFILSSLEIP
jgi:ribonuclease J